MAVLMANIGWTDEARAASLAVRRMKAALRKARDFAEAGGLVARTSEGVVRIDPAAGAAKGTYPLAPDAQQARMVVRARS